MPLRENFMNKIRYSKRNNGRHKHEITLPGQLLKPKEVDLA